MSYLFPIKITANEKRNRHVRKIFLLLKFNYELRKKKRTSKAHHNLGKNIHCGSDIDL